MLATPLESMCWQKGVICGIAGELMEILRWKPGDAEPRAVAGEGGILPRVNPDSMAVLPDGEILVGDLEEDRLVSFQNGFGRVLLSDADGLEDVFCSPNGVVYVLNQNGTAVGWFDASTIRGQQESC